VLTRAAKETGSSGLDDPFDGAPALIAWRAFAVINREMLLEVSELTAGTGKV